MLLSTMILDKLLQLPISRIALITALVVFLVIRYIMSPWRKVPPGPKGLPFIGHTFRLCDKDWMFKKDIKRKFRASNTVSSHPRPQVHKSETLDHMMYLDALGQPILVINGLKTAFELLDRRASIYSDRPRVIVAHEILCGGLFTVFIRYGDVLVWPSPL
jgi:hypothetical protein